MKKLLTMILLSAFLYGIEYYQPQQKMSWYEANRYCFALGGRIASVDQMEKDFKLSNPEYKQEMYWTRTGTDMNGAYSFDFTLGLAQPDHESRKYNVMCVK